MEKLTPAQVSYLDDCVILYCIYMMMGHFISRLFQVMYFMLIKYMCNSKSQTLRKSYPFQSTSRPISHWNRWSFCVYMIPLWNFVPECNSRSSTTTGVNSRRSDSHRHDILWWYQVNKYRATRGNRSELPLVLKSPQYHVNTPLVTNWPQKTVISNTNTGLIEKIWYIKMRAFCTHTLVGTWYSAVAGFSDPPSSSSSESPDDSDSSSDLSTFWGGVGTAVKKH